MACPQPRDMAPDFVLPSYAGKRYQISSFRGRRNLVLVFAGESGREVSALIDGLIDLKEELDFEEAQLLVIVRKPVVPATEVMRLEWPVFLTDADGAVHQQYGVAESAVVLTDRYGEIIERYCPPLPPAEDLITSLSYINAACPE